MQSDDENPSDQPGNAAIRKALDAVLTSTPLRRSPTQRTLLTYVVEQTLAGNAARIKAYNIATEALERDGSFDPANDPIVRVEAMRLRQALEIYYRDEGRDEPIVISLPKGRYVPHFAWSAKVTANDSSASLAAPPARATPRAVAPSVELVSINLAPLGTRQERLAKAIHHTLIDAIGRFGFIRWASSARHDTALIIPSQSMADFVIRMAFTAASARAALSYTYQVWEQDGQTIIWQGAGTVLDKVALHGAVATLCGAVFGHSGCIHRHNLAQLLSGKVFDAQYECKLRYLNVVQIYGDPVREAEVRMQIEAQLQHDYGFAFGYSFLAHLLYRQSHGYPPGRTFDNLLLRAWHLALRGTELSPNSSFTHATLYWLSDLRGETKIAEAALQAGMKLNPYDDELVMAHGARLICNGDWAAGVAMIEPRLPPAAGLAVQYLFFLALGKYLLGDLAGAETYGLRIPADLATRTQSHPGALLLRALIATGRGDVTLAHDAAVAMEDTLLAAHTNIATFLGRFMRHQPSRARIESELHAVLSSTNNR